MAFPLLALLLVPLALLIALSRVVLGLHYPSDVLAGALLGAGVAAAALSWPLL
jgi:undecaprenyl-diphosphatase